MKAAFANPTITTFERGNKNYEQVNHLGNALASISDKKLQHVAGSTVDYNEADVINVNDFYPFGMMMPERKFVATTASKYRYSINGQEQDLELHESMTTAEYWEYDSRIGRRWNVDPKPKIGISSYSTFNNNPISFGDLKGDTTEIRNSKGEVLGTHKGKEGNYVLTLSKENDSKWDKWKKNNFREINDKKLSDADFVKFAVSQGNVYDVNSAKAFYESYSGKGTVDKIYGTPISLMKNITLDGKNISKSALLEFIKKENLGPEWGANWIPNQKGIMQLSNPQTDNDLTEFSPGPHLAHLHPNTSTTHIITFNFKLSNDKQYRTGYVELGPKAPVDGVDLYEGEKWGKLFPNQWNTVTDKNAIWFYNGNYDRFKINRK